MRREPDQPHDPSPDADNRTPEQAMDLDRDILITRIIDGEAGPEDWAAFKALAAREPSVWRDLAECQQDQADLALAVGDAARIADSIDLPMDEARSLRLAGRVRRAVSWGGWAMAAVVALAFMTQGRGSTPPGQGTTNTAGWRLPEGTIPVSTPDEAYDAYLELGRQQHRFVEEAPTPLLVETRLLQDGRLEVHYVRRVVERVTVRDLFEVGVGVDETGRAVPIRVRATRGEPPL